MPDFIDRFGEIGPDGAKFLSSSRQSIITSLLSAGSGKFLLRKGFSEIDLGSGALAQAFTSDRFGRRGSILIWAAIFTIGVAVQTGTTFSIVQVTIGRFIAGLGVGALSGTIDAFSSRHLLGRDREAEARTVIAELNAVPESDPLVDEIVEELDFAIKAENEGGKATWAECFSTRNNLWKRTGNGMMLQFIQQLNGQNFYYYYGDTFFQSAGTELSPYVIQVILGAVSVVGTVPALVRSLIVDEKSSLAHSSPQRLIETWGRRRSLLTGALLEAACSIIAGLAGHFTLAPTGTPKELLTSRNKRGGKLA
ncbi:hypothetical protein C0989_000784 [Termitomyces sp. Mn162]|nr:hypothetical protein C0989_000784 [Termitomyces sp. Mn162]